MAAAAHTTQTPTSGDLANGAPITVGVRFTVDTVVNCAGVAFWVPATNTGVYTGALYRTTSDDVPDDTGTGILLTSATAAAAVLTAGGWGQVLFPTPIALTPGVVYTAARHATSGQYVATVSVFDDGPIAGSGITLLQSGTNPTPPGLGTIRNGVFVEGADLAYPVTFFNTADYFIDVVLAPGGARVANARTATLVASTVYRWNPAYNGSRVEVTSMDGAAEIYFTTNGVDPTVGGDNCVALPATISSVEVPDEVSGNADIRLISTGTPKISVRVW